MSPHDFRYRSEKIPPLASWVAHLPLDADADLAPLIVLDNNHTLIAFDRGFRSLLQYIFSYIGIHTYIHTYIHT